MTLPTRPLGSYELFCALADKRHHGFGYATARAMPKADRLRLDALVLELLANEIGMCQEELFHWTNSKDARWLVSAVYGRDVPIVRATVEKALNAKLVKEVVREAAR